MTETELADAIIRHALELQRLSDHEAGRVELELRALTDDLRQLLSRNTLSAASKRELAAIIKAADGAIAGRYINIAGVVDMDGLISHVAERTLSTIQAGFPALTLPAPERIASLAKDVLIDGARSAAWWAKQSEDLQFKFAGIVRRGVINGHTNEQIVREVAGRGGIMDTSRRNARALVHSSIMTAANQARMETYRKSFGKTAKGVRWLATLDSHVCWTAETPIMVVGGKWKPAGELRAGDWVIGGVSGKPCRVILADKRLVQSSVVIYLDGDRIGAVTHDHPILTPTGWKEAGSFSLSADVSEREVLCRHHKASERPLSGTSSARRGGAESRTLSSMAEARTSENGYYRQSDRLRDGVCYGDRADREPEYEGSQRLQHDGRRGQSGWGYPQRDMALEDCCAQSGARSHAGIPRVEPAGNQAPLERPRAAGEDERGAGICASGIASRPGVEGETRGEVCRDDAPQVARPGLSGENGRAKASADRRSDPQEGGGETLAVNDAGAAFRSCTEVLGHPEGVSVGRITCEEGGEVEVITLSIEDDPTYIAGGIIVHNCTTCAALDGSQWDFDGKPLAGTKLSFQVAPAHFSCRCVMTPILKPVLDDIFGTTGLDAKLAKTPRATSQGPVDDMTFNSFLKRQSPDFIEDVLGARRAELYRSGKITLSDLVTKAGREKTLAELR